MEPGHLVHVWAHELFPTLGLPAETPTSGLPTLPGRWSWLSPLTQGLAHAEAQALQD